MRRSRGRACASAKTTGEHNFRYYMIMGFAIITGRTDAPGYRGIASNYRLSVFIINEPAATIIKFDVLPVITCRELCASIINNREGDYRAHSALLYEPKLAQGNNRS